MQVLNEVGAKTGLVKQRNQVHRDGAAHVHLFACYSAPAVLQHWGRLNAAHMCSHILR